MSDNEFSPPTEEVTDAMGQVFEDLVPSKNVKEINTVDDPIYDHRYHTGMLPDKSSQAASIQSTPIGSASGATTAARKARQPKRNFVTGPSPSWNNISAGVSSPQTKLENTSASAMIGSHSHSNAQRKYGTTTRNSTSGLHFRSEPSVPDLSRYQVSPVPPIISNQDVFLPRGGVRRRAYSEVDHNTRNYMLNREYSPFDEQDDMGDDDSSVYISSNPSSREGSISSSIDDVCFPVDTIDDSGKKRMWPDIQILEDFANQEAEEIKKVNEASAALSQDSSVPEPGEGVNFEYPLVSNVDQGDSLTEPLIQTKEEEANLINERLRPPKLTPWDIQRHDSFKARQAMLENFRFTYFREDLPETIHSTNISGLTRKENTTFSDLFCPSYYGPKVQQSQAQTSPLNSDSLHNYARESTPQLSQANSKISKIGTASTTPTPSVADYSHVEKQNVPAFWLDVYNPTEDEMKVMSKTFGIHPLTTEDIFLGEAREKVELFKDYYFVCFTSFDVAQEHHRQKAIEKAHALSVLEEEEESRSKNETWFQRFRESVGFSRRTRSDIDRVDMSSPLSSKPSLRRSTASTSSQKTKLGSRQDELVSLNMYIIVFGDGVITFHFRPTPHPSNVRRRVRLLRDYLTVTSDWIGYALIDDITDAFAPLIESIETEVNAIEDEILVMQSGEHSDSDDSSDEEDEEDRVWVRLKRRSSTVGVGQQRSLKSYKSSLSSTSSSSSSTKIISWKRKGDMLRRIGECRRRVMSLLRLLGTKPDVIKGFAKRCNEQWQVAPKSEIGLYLGDIQDHVVTMVQSLNHYEKVLARSHSNYLAQINIDMTKVNNDMNDILGKITILGSIVLPLNIITGLWGMNCLVPGQDVENLKWFWGILAGMMAFSMACYLYARRVSGLV
ncbi:hypothetical protein FOA43_000747 [Brettanomyces nanus]|uniref:Uncharacterized protein n=1 Tax=Eeniella nana TaxID=13502 RepID=A0A875RTF4_EENNA|nr:uncharacterized protein FOA43_000747 [Brettanomyces nanus]QPG73437.1 hypothetical protein FOA43_000747 [Brettanomyces nanus]